MVTVENYVKGGVLRPYEKLEIKRLKEGAYEASWVDISKYMLKGGQARIARKLDTSFFGFSSFSVSRASFKIDNSGGIFFPPYIQNSLFFGYDTRQYARVRYEAGYINPDGTKLEEKVFEGLLNEKTIKTSIMTGEATFTAVAYEGILQDRRVPLLTFSGTKTVAEVASTMFTDTVVSRYLTYNAAKINPRLTISIDVSEYYNGKTIREVLDILALKSNSVWYIDNDNELVIKNRQANAGTPFAFVGGNTKNKNVNIIDRFDYDEGYKNIINWITWDDGATVTQYSGLSTSLELFGTNELNVDGGDITAFLQKQTIANDIIAQNSIPLRKVVVRTFYMPNKFELFDTCTIDWNGTPNVSDIMVWNGDDSFWNNDEYYLTLASGFNLDPTTEWVIIGYEYDTRQTTMDIYLVESWS